VARPQNGIYRRKINSPLLDYKSDVTSQCGEDGIIAHICEVIEPANRYCIEFGAWDGKHLSNCYNLIVNAGWGALMIEANAQKFKELEATYAGHPRVQRVNRLVDFEGTDTLDRILEEAGAPKEPGVLSIDIDGNDYYIFQSLTTHRPELVIVEFNPTIPNDVIFVQERSFEVNHGCSLLALVLLGREKGYELAVATACNGLFVRADKFPLLGITDNSISALYAPLQDGRIFQGYDSTIHVVGMDHLVWHRGMRVSSADFQVLPAAARVWNDAQKKKD
jgi:hypothetical protein